ncbi:alpha/beta fold hydrolase [Polymorphobacter fuscus]|uniref:Alpha/beta fold hydrolase n=1 Tax=Sandarakinorhabdus fusca TaxID=1439888 RepID=A0A7C9KJU7_9SPHN|nr:alpha/beta fold hydrolase [Polymorphobacter fuscus]MQT16063.1 alpha/beta fold hydrolase [Polymorphobacter fuscus]
MAVPAAARPPAALHTDPPRDVAHPARMEVLHVPSGDVAINGVAYLAAGKGPHPTLVIAHGWPGNEKNLDLAQAVRRAGWNAVTFNYRGSWGSPGAFQFAQVPQDLTAVVAYLRRPAVADRLGVDSKRIVLAGHSMGGWATAITAAKDPALAGAITISLADLGLIGGAPRGQLIAQAAMNSETLAGTSPEMMADELISGAAANRAAAGVAGLKALPMLVLTSDDGLAPGSASLVSAIQAAGGARVTAAHVATDHSWSDARLRLETLVIDWLEGLK